MTNEEAKQAAIINAWVAAGVTFSPSIEPVLFSDGYMFTKDSFDGELFDHDYNHCRGNEVRIRPKSARGIEFNNGWTRIEPDGSNIPGFALYITDSKGTPMFTKNLPKGSPGLFEWCEDGKPQIHFMNAHQIKARWMRNQMGSPVGKITHFKKWEPSKPPVY